MAQNNQFKSRFGAVAATVGGAIGLGNIWRFPYEMGQNGGGAFLMVYLGCVLLVGVPVMLTEFSIGRSTHKGATQAIRTLSPGTHLHWFTLLGPIVSLLITGFYTVVAGWILQRIIRIPNPTVCSLLVLAMTSACLMRGVQKGIERVCNIMMPVLFVLLLILCARVCMLPGAEEGLRFMFVPDFSAINGKVMLSALGQAFFSLALGSYGVMTYAAYFSDKENLTRSAWIVSLLDTLIAVMAGVMIFPAIFATGNEVAAGPDLLFRVMPEVFDTMPAGPLWSFIFFLMLFFAAISSLFCINEIAISYCEHEMRLGRKKATIAQTVLSTVFVLLASFSYSWLSDFKPLGRTFFDWFDYLASNWIMPLSGLFCAMFVGWYLPKRFLMDQLCPDAKQTSLRARLTRGNALVNYYLIRYFAPLAILLIFMAGLGIF